MHYIKIYGKIKKKVKGVAFVMTAKISEVISAVEKGVQHLSGKYLPMESIEHDGKLVLRFSAYDAEEKERDIVLNCFSAVDVVNEGEEDDIEIKKVVGSAGKNSYAVVSGKGDDFDVLFYIVVYFKAMAELEGISI